MAMQGMLAAQQVVGIPILLSQSGAMISTQYQAVTNGYALPLTLPPNAIANGGASPLHDGLLGTTVQTAIPTVQIAPVVNASAGTTSIAEAMLALKPIIGSPPTRYASTSSVSSDHASLVRDPSLSSASTLTEFQVLPSIPSYVSV